MIIYSIFSFKYHIMALMWILLLVCTVAYWLYFRRSKLNVPGPTGLPLIGNALHLDPGKGYLTISDWAKKHGPVVKFTVFTQDILTLNSHETIHEMLVTRGEDFGGRPVSVLAERFSGYKNILAASPLSPHWKVMRRSAHKYIKLCSGERLESEVCRIIQYRMEKLAEYSGKSFNIRDEIYNFTLSSMFFLLFGEKVDDANAEFNLCKQFEQKIVAIIGPSRLLFLIEAVPVLNYLPNKIWNEFEDVEDLFNRFWDHKKERFAPGTDDEAPDCLLEALYKMKDSMNDTDPVIKLVIRDLIIAGITTTSTSLYALVALLTQHPEVQKKLQNEVDEVVGDDRNVVLDDRRSMPYTQAVIWELLRYASIVPLGLPHVTLRDTSVSGHLVPQGTTVFANLWLLHHDEQFWGDPWNYRPERYLDETGSLLTVDHPNRKHLLPFGAGLRVCIGEQFALKRIFLFTASLMQRYHVKPDDEGRVPSHDPRTYKTGLVIGPEDYNICLVARTS